VLPHRASLFSMNVVAPLTSEIVPHAILKMRLDGIPHDENDSDAEAHKEKQCDRPEHALPSLDLAIHAAASIDCAADSQLLDTTPLLAPARGVPPENPDRSHDLGPCALACELRPAIIRSSGPGFFTFGSNIANPSRLEM
jgi:hypothetical protein